MTNKREKAEIALICENFVLLCTLILLRTNPSPSHLSQQKLTRFGKSLASDFVLLSCHLIIINIIIGIIVIVIIFSYCAPFPLKKVTCPVSDSWFSGQKSNLTFPRIDANSHWTCNCGPWQFLLDFSFLFGIIFSFLVSK